MDITQGLRDQRIAERTPGGGSFVRTAVVGATHSERPLRADSVEKQRVENGLSGRFERAQAVLLSGFSWMLRCGKELSQFPEVLGGGGEEEFVVCATWAA